MSQKYQNSIQIHNRKHAQCALKFLFLYLKYIFHFLQKAVPKDCKGAGGLPPRRQKKNKKDATTGEDKHLMPALRDSYPVKNKAFV